MEKPDREIKVGKNTLYLGEDNILHQILVGRLDKDLTTIMHQASVKLRNIVDGKVDMLINIDKVKAVSPEATEMGLTSVIDEKVGKVAIVGMNPLVPALLSPFMGAVRKRNVAFFKIEEAAMQWLKK